MPTPRAKDDASEHSTTPSNVGKSSSRCPKQASAVPTSRDASVQHGTQTEGTMKPQTHPMEEFKKDQQVRTMEVTCNSCITRVKGRDALGHLFFGRLKCANCMFIISHCERFRRCYPVFSKCPKTQKPHSLTDWVMPVWNYLIYCARRENAISGFYNNDKSNIDEEALHDMMASYLKALLPLKDILPWKSAFTDPSLETIMKARVLVSEPQKSKPKGKVVQQNQTQVTLQVSSPVTSSASHAAPQFSPQKRNMVQKRDNQESTPRKQEDHNNSPLTTHATKPLQLDMKVRAEATKALQVNTEVKADECSEMRHKDPPLATQVSKKSTPKKRKTHQSSTIDTDKDIRTVNSTLTVTKRTSGLSEENSSDLSLSKRGRKPGKGKKKPYLDIIPKNVLHSMKYLVLQLSPQLCLKECPNCYYPLNAEMCSVNISTCVVHLMCPNCDLAVYVVPEELYSEPA